MGMLGYFGSSDTRILYNTTLSNANVTFTDLLGTGGVVPPNSLSVSPGATSTVALISHSLSTTVSNL